jgi:predicted metalloprotease
MKWTPGGSTEDIEDRRGQGGGGFRGGPVGIGVVLVLLVVSLLTGRNFLSLLDPNAVGGTDQPSSSGPVSSSPDEDRLVQFVTFVINDAQATWARLLPGEYQKTTLVLFRDSTPTACGMGQVASGQRFGASGDFAQAYVIAHELGHHIQRLRGIEGRVRQAQEARPSAANALSVRLELQADCYAGIWGHSTAERQILEAGDVDEALSAAASIGDDRIQRMSGRGVQPESFTHGSSAQRVEWFKRGFESGDLDTCDTFARGTD